MYQYFQNNDLDEIIPNLWLGNYVAAIDLTNLENKGIKKILTVMDYDDGLVYDKSYIHKKCKVEDSCRQNIIQYFGECLNFIKGGEKVLVHCMAGASRSATIVIAYIMWSQRWPFQRSIALVRDKRPLIGPNEGFVKQLEMFENYLIYYDYDIGKIDFKAIQWKPTEEMLKVFL